MTTFADLGSRSGARRDVRRAARPSACSPRPISSASACSASAPGRRASGDRVTFGRVRDADGEPDLPASRRSAGEVRLVGRPVASIDDAADAWSRRDGGRAGSVPLTGFSLADLLALVGGDHLALADLRAQLRADGTRSRGRGAARRVRRYRQRRSKSCARLAHGGLGAWRLDRRSRAARRTGSSSSSAPPHVQRETGAVRAFAPLPRLDPADSAVDRLRRRPDGRGGAADVPRHSAHSGGLAALRPEAGAGGDCLRRERHRRRRRRRHARRSARGARRARTSSARFARRSPRRPSATAATSARS